MLEKSKWWGNNLKPQTTKAGHKKLTKDRCCKNVENMHNEVTFNMSEIF